MPQQEDLRKEMKTDKNLDFTKAQNQSTNVFWQNNVLFRRRRDHGGFNYVDCNAQGFSTINFVIDPSFGHLQN
ncbi:hypothetical protein CS542_04060 [Pedobacter sp. IW39]|nr:hypothetical protein CS542_04060 [Pedobacter sp. IW39]